MLLGCSECKGIEMSLQESVSLIYNWRNLLLANHTSVGLCLRPILYKIWSDCTSKAPVRLFVESVQKSKCKDSMIWFSVNIKKMLVGGFFQASRFSSFPVLYQTKQIVASYLNRGK